MRIPRKVALLSAAVFVLALPASNAFGAASATDKKQNTRIAKLSKDLTTLKKTALTLSGTLATKTQLDGVDNRLKAIEAAAPQIINGLTQLKDAATALKTGLETAGAGLTSLKTLATSTEYGIGQVIVDDGTPAAEGGSFVVTPDIPDAVQQAQTTGQFVATTTGPISLQVGVRSAETDGTGASDPAASCRVTVVDDLGAFVTSKPNAALGGAPFYGIPTKSVQTSTAAPNAGFPFGPKTSGADADSLVDLTTASNSQGTATAHVGTVYTVTLSCVDTTPSTTDPGA